MSKWYFVYLILIVLVCVSVDLSAKEELDWDTGDYVLVFSEKTGWKGIRGDETLRQTYTIPGMTAENWTIKIEILNLPIAITLGSKVRWEPESILMSSEADCSETEVIKKDEKSILYERTNISCKGYLHQQAIGRVILGKWYMWWISYGIRNRTLSAEEKNNLFNRLLEAKLVVRNSE